MLSPWRLGWVALVLFVLYLTVVLGSAFPFRLLNPTWQLTMLANLVNTSGFPLVGLGVLHLASELSPDDGNLARQRRVCAQLAVPVAVGFLLLIPLQSMALWQQSSTFNNSRLAQVGRAERSLSELRQAVGAASSSADLQQRLQALKGPTLGPAEQALPLPVLKAQVRAELQRFERQLGRQQQPPQSNRTWNLIVDTLRNGVPCLALACGFAALGQRRHSPVPFLEDCLDTLARLRFWRAKRNAAKARSSGDRLADYVKELARHD